MTTTRTLLVLALWAILLPAPASAATLRYEDGSPALTMQAWADASHIPIAGNIVTIHRGNCLNGLKVPCVDPVSTDIWMPPEPIQQMRPTLAHELGHRFDFLAMTDPARAEFARLLRDQRPWWQAGPRHLTSLGEQFATAYGLCFRFRTIQHAHNEGIENYSPTPRLHRQVCRLIRQTARGVYGITSR